MRLFLRILRDIAVVFVLLLLFVLSVVVLLTSGGCAVNSLHTVCVRYVDSEGYLRGRLARFNDAGAKANAKRNPFSYEGFCFADSHGNELHWNAVFAPDGEAHGPARETLVCVTGPCGRRVNLSVWEDEVDAWVEAGGTVGACRNVNVEYAGDCVVRLQNYSGPKDFRQWQQWMRELCRSKPGGCR